MSDPVVQARAAYQAKKRRRACPVEQAEPPTAPLVSQGVRSSLPPRRPLTHDEVLRRAFWELRGRPTRVRLY